MVPQLPFLKNLLKSSEKPWSKIPSWLAEAGLPQAGPPGLLSNSSKCKYLGAELESGDKNSRQIKIEEELTKTKKVSCQVAFKVF